MSKPTLGIIILNWNGKSDTLECLNSVTHSRTKSVNIIIYLVDNGSRDKSVSLIRSKFPQITIIQNQQNLGYAGGNNKGIKKALQDKCNYIVLLNNDTTVSPDTFEHLYLGAVAHQFDIASPKIYFYPGREFHYHDYQPSQRGKVIWYAGGRIDWDNVIAQQIGVNELDYGQHDQASLTEFATGCCMLISQPVLTQVGLLDAVYRAYYEDNDFCQRAKKHGFRIGYVPTAHLWHKNAGSSGGSGSARQVRLVNRSRLTFAMRYAPLRAKLALVKHILLGHTNY